MEITNNVKGIIEDTVDLRLESAKLRSEEISRLARICGDKAIAKADARARETIEREQEAFKKWLAKNCPTVELRLSRYDSFFGYSRGLLHSKAKGVEAVDAFRAFRRTVLNRALRIASENPPRTAYAEVDKYLAGLDPFKELGI